MKDKPTAPYVYQPWGALEDNEWVAANRMWGVGHPSGLVTIKGLTRPEADAVCTALKPETAAELERAQKTNADLLKMLKRARGMIAESGYRFEDIDNMIARAETSDAD